jgi:hypothetical protein
MSERIKTTVYLDAGEYRLLQAQARGQNRPAAELLREAVVEYSARRRPGRRPRSLGAGRSGRSDLSERAGTLLRGFGRR